METQRSVFLKKIKKLEVDYQIAMFMGKHKEVKKLEKDIQFHKDCITHMM